MPPSRQPCPSPDAGPVSCCGACRRARRSSRSASIEVQRSSSVSTGTPAAALSSSAKRVALSASGPRRPSMCSGRPTTTRAISRSAMNARRAARSFFRPRLSRQPAGKAIDAVLVRDRESDPLAAEVDAHDSHGAECSDSCARCSPPGRPSGRRHRAYHAAHEGLHDGSPRRSARFARIVPPARRDRLRRRVQLRGEARSLPAPRARGRAHAEACTLGHGDRDRLRAQSDEPREPGLRAAVDQRGALHSRPRLAGPAPYRESLQHALVEARARACARSCSRSRRSSRAGRARLQLDFAASSTATR